MYSAYDELMGYFQFEFNVYLALVAIIIVGLAKALFQYRQVRQTKDPQQLHKTSPIYDLLTSIIALLGLTSAMFFQGVMSDIPLESGQTWLNHSFYLFVGGIVLFNLQLIFILLKDMTIRKYRADQTTESHHE
jgi:divalent metal cation (Fe/Co/Zn/Cd) transporter